MALAVTGRFNIRDAEGTNSFTEINVPTSLNLVQLGEFYFDVAQDLADLSGGELTSVGFGISFDLSSATLRTVADAVSHVARKGFFQWATALTGFFKRFRIPSFDEALTSGTSDDIDLADPLVDALIDGVNDGYAVTGPDTISFTDTYTNDIEAVTVAREQHNKSN